MPAEDRKREIAKLYEDYHHEILAYCIRRVGYDDAEDVASEVFAVAWRRRHELDLDTGRAWLFGVARGIASNRWRSVLRRRRLDVRLASVPDEPVPGADGYFAHSRDEDEVLSALRRLRPSDQEILMLAAWEELTGPEIAGALEISISAAEQRLHRAKKRFARLMSPDSGRSELTSRAAAEEGDR